MFNNTETRQVFNITLEDEELMNLMSTGIPALTFLASLCFFGTFGNGLTILVYAVRFKPSIHRTFILWLGTVDLVACSVSVPYVIYDSTHPYTFTSEWSCRCFVFINFVFSMYSPLLLDVIAIERYRRICKATDRQLTRSEAKLISGLMGAVVIIACSPVFALYGSKPVITPFNHLEGHECNVVERFSASLFETVYFGILFGAYFVLFVLCIVFYSLIGQKLMKSERFRRATKAAKRLRRQQSMRQIERTHVRQKSVKFVTEVIPEPQEKQNEIPTAEEILNNEPTMSEISITSISGTCELQPNSLNDNLEDRIPENTLQLPDKQHTALNENGQKTVVISYDLPSEHDKIENNNTDGMELETKAGVSQQKDVAVKNSSLKAQKSVKRFVDHRVSKKKVSQLISKSKRVTLMFLVVSALSFGGYLPYFVHVVMRNADDVTRRHLAVALGSLGPIMRYSFFINNAVNPIVYGFMDRHFRDQFKRMIKKCRRNRIDFN
ncbi:D(2) dopamine receptor-like [Ylistrum balloti]|uniref:D(2) dopamine receptor-like n=1 Tax=Ylistrum balloti TaxID=509963 RepID=UPI002905D891|nr:D(2) dopamine receptor-like [Ylistrum balloti]